MNAGELKALLANVPDHLPVRFVLNENGTELDGDFVAELGVKEYDDDDAEYVSVLEPGDTRFPVEVILFEIVSLEDDAKGFCGHVRLGLPKEFVAWCHFNKIQPADILHSFIADICGITSATKQLRSDGLYSNGPEPLRLAQEYGRHLSCADLNTISAVKTWFH